MKAIIYKNQTVEYPIESVMQVDNIMTVYANQLTASEGGFCIMVDGKKLEYYDFATIYDSTDNWVKFSNDGSTKPIDPTPTPIPEPEPSTDPTPNIMEQMSEVYDAICDLDDRVFALENSEA